MNANEAIDSEAARIAKEYEYFAYIVSHDLGAPLRHIKQFSQLLMDARGDDIGADEKEYAQYLNKALRRIDSMQEALLTFSRLNTQKDEAVAVDCNDVLAGIIQDFKKEGGHNTDPIFASSLPTVVMGRNQTQFLFKHIIDNALKFRKSDFGDTRVEVSAVCSEGQWVFEVKDNGIGIDERFHEDVFLMFKKLQADAYGGVGCGLTFAKKIITMNGGRIWIKSTPNGGTSVFFTCPKP